MKLMWCSFRQEHDVHLPLVDHCITVSEMEKKHEKPWFLAMQQSSLQNNVWQQISSKINEMLLFFKTQSAHRNLSMICSFVWLCLGSESTGLKLRERLWLWFNIVKSTVTWSFMFSLLFNRNFQCTVVD